MSDRTQHVIDAIDGALDDWSVSDDAMRWMPEPESEAAPPPFGGSLELRGGRLVEHRPGCSIVHEYLNRPPSCQCGALDRAALSLQSPTSWSRQNRLDTAMGVAVRAAADHARAEQALREMFEDAGAAIEQMVERFRSLADGMGQTMPQLVETLRQLAAAEAAPQPCSELEGARDRALRLRQERNTGPGRTPAGRQKRPRRLP